MQNKKETSVGRASIDYRVRHTYMIKQGNMRRNTKELLKSSMKMARDLITIIKDFTRKRMLLLDHPKITL